MRVELLNQVPGYKSNGETLRALLQNPEKGFYNLKFLMAFANLNGLDFIKDSLEAFYDRGGTLELIIGLDNGITTHEALKYLIERFPGAEIYLFHDKSPDVIFHPKVIILEGKEVISFIIGSTNLTLGGLFSNFEASVLLEADRKKDEELISQFQSLWNTYRRPAPPLGSAHLLELNMEWLKKNRDKFDTRKQREQKERQQRKSKFTEFGAVRFARPRKTSSSYATRKPNPGRRANAGSKNDTSRRALPLPSAATRPVERTGDKLYLEILAETREGNQVQVPTEVVTSYFQGSLSESKQLRLSINGAPYREVSISHFSNHTHRISINELTGVARPAMLVFDRKMKDSNTYTCAILTGQRYRNALAQCAEQTRAGSRRWGIR